MDENVVADVYRLNLKTAQFSVLTGMKTGRYFNVESILSLWVK